METCVGCGSPVAPAWKFCIHCGMAIEPREIPAAIRPDASAAPPRGGRLYVLGGIGLFLVGIALLVVAVAFFDGAFR